MLILFISVILLIILNLGLLLYRKEELRKINHTLNSINELQKNPEIVEPYYINYEKFINMIEVSSIDDNETNYLKFSMILERLYNYNFKLLEKYIRQYINSNSLDDMHLFLINSLKISNIELNYLIFEELLHYLFKNYSDNNKLMSNILTLLEIYNNPKYSEQFKVYTLPSKSLNRRLITLHHNTDLRLFK